mmetsp:Transcript_127177/g.354130  ORF Transcript_127177/g.354130 Transcript_127177/m.354130 type:complete len:255 (+) Transcript_127177:1150-1914(+)
MLLSFLNTLAIMLWCPDKSGRSSGHELRGKLPGHPSLPPAKAPRTCPCSSFCSKATNLAQPWITALTESTSDTPKRLRFVTSHTPSALHCTCNRRLSQTCCSAACCASSGSFNITLICKPVPRFEGHAEMYPKRSKRANSWPSSLMDRSMLLSVRTKREKAPARSLPCSEEITCMWSCSLHHTASFRDAAAYTPRACGQPRARPAETPSPESGAWKSKRCLSRSDASSGVMPPGLEGNVAEPASGKYSPRRSSS